MELGNVYLKEEKFDTARKYYEKALEITEETQKEENTPQIRRDIAV